MAPEHEEAPAVPLTPRGHGGSDMTATPTTILAHLPAIVAALTAAHPGAVCRIARGAALVVADAVAPVYSIGYLVASASEPGRSYWVQRVGDVLTCDCADHR